MSGPHVFTALDGSNPLGFLAALGALRLVHLDLPDASVTLKWIRRGGWVPQLEGIEEDEQALCTRLYAAGRRYLPADIFSELLGKNITVDVETFTKFVKAAEAVVRAGDRIMGDFAVAFGSEVCKQERNDRMEYTEFCFITGSGHQHFLGTMDALQQAVTADHLRDALFGEWTTSKGFSMRWDPADAAEYAFRWGDPSAEGASAVWGANWLAVHALPLFPAYPTEHGLRTTGFRDAGRGQWPEFSWPIWVHPIGLDTIRSLLANKGLHCAAKEIDRGNLRALGVAEVYRAPRVRIGQGANYKVSFRPAVAV